MEVSRWIFDCLSVDVYLSVYFFLYDERELEREIERETYGVYTLEDALRTLHEEKKISLSQREGRFLLSSSTSSLISSSPFL